MKGHKLAPRVFACNQAAGKSGQGPAGAAFIGDRCLPARRWWRGCSPSRSASGGQAGAAERWACKTLGLGRAGWRGRPLRTRLPTTAQAGCGFGRGWRTAWGTGSVSVCCWPWRSAERRAICWNITLVSKDSLKNTQSCRGNPSPRRRIGGDRWRPPASLLQRERARAMAPQLARRLGSCCGGTRSPGASTDGRAAKAAFNQGAPFWISRKNQLG